MTNSQNRPALSVIIPTCDRPRSLARLLNELEKQSFQNFEIIVVDQSRDPLQRDAATVLAERTQVIHLNSKHRALAKNVGFKSSQGDIICFLDDDIIPERNLFETHVTALQETSLGGVSCRVTEDGEKKTSSDNILRVTAYGRSLGGRQSDTECFVESLVGGNMSIPRVVLEESGLFETSFIGTSILEEYDISARIRALGYQLLFTNKSQVKHFPQPGGSDHARASNPAKFFHDFNHNMMIYFLKNKPRVLLPLAIVFAIIRTAVRGFQYSMNVMQMGLVLKGILNGFSTYRHLNLPKGKSAAQEMSS